MDNPYISIEQLAAYFDGNLSAADADRVEAALGNDPDMEELIAIADQVDDDIAQSTADGSAYDAEYQALAYDDFPLPELDASAGAVAETDDTVIVYADEPADDPSDVCSDDQPFSDDNSFTDDDSSFAWDDGLY